MTPPRAKLLRLSSIAVLAAACLPAIGADYLSVWHARTLTQKKGECPEGVKEVGEFTTQQEAKAHAKAFSANKMRTDQNGGIYKRGTLVFVYQHESSSAWVDKKCRFTAYGHFTANSKEAANDLLENIYARNKERMLTKPSFVLVWNGEKLN